MKRYLISIFFSVCFIFSTLLCQAHDSRSEAHTEKIEFNLEVILPLTGNLAFLGDPIKNAFVLAKEHWQKKLNEEKISINLIFGDSQGSPKTAVTIYHKEKALKNIHGVFSFLSGQTLALKPLAAADNIFFIAATVDPSVCKNSKNLIRPYYSFGAEGRAMVEVVSEKKPNKVGIIYSTDSATAFEVEQIVLPGLKRMGIPSIIQPYRVGNRDFRTQVAVIKSEAPETVLTYGFGSDLPFLIHTIREQRVFNKSMVIGPIGIADAIPSKTTRPFVGMYYFGPTFLYKNYEKQNPEYCAFKTAYISRYGAVRFNESAVYAYDAYGLLSQAILTTRSIDATSLMRIFTLKKMYGLAGEYTFDKSGNCNPPVGFAHILENGEIKLLRVFNGQ